MRLCVKMGNEITFEFWIISLLSMFILLIVFFSVGHFLIGLKHPPFAQVNALGGVSVYIYHVSRTGKGSYSEYEFFNDGDRWTYQINRERMKITLILFAVMMLPFYCFVYLKSGMSLGTFLKIVSIISEAFIIPMLFDPVYAYLFLKRTER